MRHKGALLLGLLLTPIFVSLQLAVPQIIRRAIGKLEESSIPGSDLVIPEGFWRQTFLLLLACAFGYSILRFIARNSIMRVSRFVEADLKLDFFKHLTRLPLEFHDKARIGDLISRSNQDIELMRFMAGPTLFFGLSIVLIFPAIVYFIFDLSTLLGVAVLFFFSVIGLIMVRIFGGLQAKSRAVQDAQGEIGAKAQEDFSGVRVLQAFARESAQVGAFRTVADRCLEAQVELAKARGKLDAIFVTAGNAGLLAVISVGVADGLSVGDLLTAVLYLQILVWPLLICGWIMQTWFRSRAAVDRIDDIFAVQPEEEERQEADIAVHEQLAPSIEARGLSFRYNEAQGNVLVDINFKIEAHGTLGLVGPIGSGKSTLVSLLTRLYNPPRNTLFLGGKDVCELSLRELRQQISVAPQESFLFGDSLKNNILFGADLPISTNDDLIQMQSALVSEAVNSSRLAPDLLEFTDGIDQIIGERGLTLSGGQKQRTSLARALAGRRKVLVLDDTLSAVDQETEKHILEEMRVRKNEQTTVLIAHRLEAVRDADLILVLDKGRVIERGTHKELIAQLGWYAKTWAQQQEEREKEEEEEAAQP